MNIPKELIALLFGAGVFFVVITVFAIQHASRAVNIKSGKVWLFEDWQTHIYDALFANKDPKEFGKKFGIDIDQYYNNCVIIKKEPRPKAVIVDKLCGYAILALGCAIGFPSLNMIVVFVALLIAFPFITMPIYLVETAAEKQKFTIADELPRFLDMLHTALLIGMPVEQAIELTAKNLPGTLLASELLVTLAETKVGAFSWQKALERLARKYNVDPLSDFVLDITNAYKLGASITESVSRKSRDIKQTNLITMKERASKLTNTILFPILIFKLVPLLLIMFIPIMLQLQQSGF